MNVWEKYTFQWLLLRDVFVYSLKNKSSLLLYDAKRKLNIPAIATTMKPRMKPPTNIVKTY